MTDLKNQINIWLDTFNSENIPDFQGLRVQVAIKDKTVTVKLEIGVKLCYQLFTDYDPLQLDKYLIKMRNIIGDALYIYMNNKDNINEILSHINRKYDFRILIPKGPSSILSTLDTSHFTINKNINIKPELIPQISDLSKVQDYYGLDTSAGLVKGENITLRNRSNSPEINYNIVSTDDVIILQNKQKIIKIIDSLKLKEIYDNLPQNEKILCRPKILKIKGYDYE